MKKIFIWVFILFIFKSFGQVVLKFEPNPELLETIQDIVPNNQVLFIFNSDLDLKITHNDVDLSEQKLKKEHGLYKLLIPFNNFPNGTINIEYKDTKSKFRYGNIINTDGTFPAVKGGEKVCYDVLLKKTLDITKEKTLRDIQNISANDAIVILNVQPVDLKFNIKSEDYIKNITETEEAKKGKYKFLINPNLPKGSFLTIQKKGYSDMKIPVDNLNHLNSKFYIIKDRNIKTGGAFLLKSNPNGALITIVGNHYFNEGKHRTPFELQELQTGEHEIILEKKGYKKYKGTINIGIGKNETIIKLTPKLGYLTILDNDGEKSGTKIFIDNKSVGTIPMQNYPLIEGEHSIRFYKTGYLPDKKLYTINIEEGQNINFNNFKLNSIKKVYISTEPKNAIVYIDGKKYPKKTNFYVKLSVKKHHITIKKKNYADISEDIIIDEDKDKYNFILSKKLQFVNFDSEPRSDVYVDNVYKGTTPLSVNIKNGRHNVKFKRKGVITKSKTYNIKNDKFYKVKLYPSYFYTFGAYKSIGTQGIEGGVIYNRFLIEYRVGGNVAKDSINVDELAYHKANIVNADEYNKEYGRVYEGETHGENSLTIGYLFAKPFPLILKVGVSRIETDSYYPVYKAKYNYEDNYGTIVIEKGDLFSTKDLTTKKYTTLRFGISTILFQLISISGEYYLNSDYGPGFGVGVGILIKDNYNSY